MEYSDKIRPQREISINLLRAILLYDEETGALTWRHRPRELFQSDHDHKVWNTRFEGKPALSYKNHHGYLTGQIFNTLYGAHRVIFALHHGFWPNHVDHINGNKSDNRISNLRSVTNRQNCLNQKMRAANTSGVMGVSWNKKKQKWRAHIKVHRKQIHLGLFAEFDRAVSCRKVAELVHGFHENHGRAA